MRRLSAIRIPGPLFGLGPCCGTAMPEGPEIRRAADRIAAAIDAQRLAEAAPQRQEDDDADPGEGGAEEEVDAGGEQQAEVAGDHGHQPDRLLATAEGFVRETGEPEPAGSEAP